MDEDKRNLNTVSRWDKFKSSITRLLQLIFILVVIWTVWQVLDHIYIPNNSWTPQGDWR